MNASMPTNRLDPVERGSVTLRDSAWKRQVDRAIEVYLGLSDDDILYGFREQSGQSNPAGKPLTGWSSTNSSVVFGQWLSGLARLAAATKRRDLADKAIGLMLGWEETLQPDGSSQLDHYSVDKAVGGLVDIAEYLGDDRAVTLLKKVVTWASRSMSRDNVPAVAADGNLHSGRAPEWYTLAENLYRAYLITDDEDFATFAEVWHYDHYWDQFLTTDRPTEAWGVHAYSHLNTFASAASAYEAGRGSRYLEIVSNAYRFFVDTQCFATGGYGPAERLQRPGGLSYNLDHRMDDFEAPCGSWAAFKVAKYLVRFTGAAEPGDWVERLLFNGIGASLGTEPDGNHFYYADYRVSGGMKTLNRDTFACCSGTYIQAVADYYEQIFFRDANGFLVSQFVPAVLHSEYEGIAVEINVDSDVPTSGQIKMAVTVARATRFSLRVRRPSWSMSVAPIITVDGEHIAHSSHDGWIVIDRVWGGTTRVDVDFAVEWSRVPVEPNHPERFALTRGPAVYVLDAWRHEDVPGDPTPLDDRDSRGSYGVSDPSVPGLLEARLQLFRDVPAQWSYRMYLDSEGIGLYPS